MSATPANGYQFEFVEPRTEQGCRAILVLVNVPLPDFLLVNCRFGALSGHHLGKESQQNPDTTLKIV